MFDETKLADAAFFEGFQKVLEQIPTRHSHPATRLPMNPIRMLLMNIIIIIIIIIIGGTAAAVLVFACVACVLVSVGLCSLAWLRFC